MEQMALRMAQKVQLQKKRELVVTEEGVIETETLPTSHIGNSYNFGGVEARYAGDSMG